jgi:hypothetical protein
LASVGWQNPVENNNSKYPIRSSKYSNRSAVDSA